MTKVTKASNPNWGGAGFKPADPNVNPRLIMAVCGLEKQGKSHFTLTAPAPIAIYNLDLGFEGVVNKFTATKQIMECGLHVPRDADQATAMWDKFEKSYYWALGEPSIRTVVIDTASELWELIRMARFGKLTQVMPYMYGPVNAEFRTILRAAYGSDKNLILSHKMRKVYKGDNWTGAYERAGFGDTGFLVQVNTQIYRDLPDDSGTPAEFHLYIKDCRQNGDLLGVTLSGALCTFPVLASMVLPDVDVDYWYQ